MCKVFPTREPAGQPGGASRFIQTPAFQRAYWRGFQDAVNGPMLLTNCGPVANTLYAFLNSNSQKQATTSAVLGAIDTELSLTNWLAGRRSYLTGELAKISSPFDITNATSSATSNIVLGGRAPVEAAFMRFYGATTNLLVSWPTLTNWNYNVTLNPGNNTFTVLGYDRRTNYLTGDSNQITISYP